MDAYCLPFPPLPDTELADTAAVDYMERRYVNYEDNMEHTQSGAGMCTSSMPYTDPAYTQADIGGEPSVHILPPSGTLASPYLYDISTPELSPSSTLTSMPWSPQPLPLTPGPASPHQPYHDPSWDDSFAGCRPGHILAAMPASSMPIESNSLLLHTTGFDMDYAIDPAATLAPLSMTQLAAQNPLTPTCLFRGAGADQEESVTESDDEELDDTSDSDSDYEPEEEPAKPPPRHRTRGASSRGAPKKATKSKLVSRASSKRSPAKAQAPRRSPRSSASSSQKAVVLGTSTPPLRPLAPSKPGLKTYASRTTGKPDCALVPDNPRMCGCGTVFSRAIEMRRHFFADRSRRVCCGVRLEDAAKFGIDLATIVLVDNGEWKKGEWKTQEVYGETRIGTCFKEFSRRDALNRHWKNAGKDCICDMRS